MTTIFNFSLLFLIIPTFVQFTSPFVLLESKNYNRNDLNIKNPLSFDQQFKIDQFPDPNFGEKIFELDIKDDLIIALDYSPDGRYLVYSTFEQLSTTETFDTFKYVIHLWDLKSYKQLREYPIEYLFQKDEPYRDLSRTGPFTHLTYSPNGTHIAFSIRASFFILNLSTGEIIEIKNDFSTNAFLDIINSLKFSLNGESIITFAEYWKPWITEGSYNVINRIEKWSLNGKLQTVLYSVSNKEDEIFVKDFNFISNGKNVLILIMEPTPFNLDWMKLTFSFILIDLQSAIKKDPIPLIEFNSSDGSFFTTIHHTIKFEISQVDDSIYLKLFNEVYQYDLINSSNLVLRTKYSGRNTEIQNIKLSPDGKYLASLEIDGTIILWDISNQKITEVFVSEAEHGLYETYLQHLVFISFSPDSSMLASAIFPYNSIKIRNIAQSGIKKFIPNYNRYYISSLAISSKNEILVIAGPLAEDEDCMSFIDVLNLSTNDLIKSIILNVTTCSYYERIGSDVKLGFSLDESALISSFSDRIIIWNTTSWQKIYEEVFLYQNLEYSALPINISPDGETIAIGLVNGTILIKHIKTGLTIHSINKPGFSRVTDLLHSSDNKILVSGHSNGRITIWNTTTWDQLNNIENTEGVSSLDLSTDGKKLLYSTRVRFLENNVAISFGTLQLWNLETNQSIFSIDGNNSINIVKFSENDQMIAIGKGWSQIHNFGSIEVLNSSDGERVLSIDTNNKPIVSFAFFEERQSFVYGTYGRNNAGDAVENFGLEDIYGYTSDIKIIQGDFQIDTDMDGIPDSFEQKYELDLDNFWDKFDDPDNDGLINSMEFISGTNPKLFDTDGNGISDGEEKGFLLRIIPDNDNEDIFFPFLMILFITAILTLFGGYLYYKKKRKPGFALVPINNLFNNSGIEKLRNIYHKILVGLENAKQFWLSEYPDDEIEKLIEKQSLDYSVPINVFPADMQQELKSDLRGRSILILVEIAYQAPNNSHASFISELLHIPLSTVIFEIKKLMFLQYIKILVNPQTLQDNRIKYYILTPKGILFLHLLKESVTLSIQNMNKQDIQDIHL